MKEQIEARVRKMLNKKYRHQSYILLISDYRFEEDTFVLIIDGKEHPFKTNIQDADVFLDQFSEYKEPMVPTNYAKPKSIIAKSASTTNNLIEILYENIDKVKEDKEYIPQAASVYKSVSQIINAMRVEMEYIRMSNKMKEGN